MKMVIADPGDNTQHTAGCFTVLGRNATVFGLDQANGIGTYTQKQQAISGLRDVESVQERERLVSFGASDMGLTVRVLHHSGDIVEHVAIIVGRRIWNIENIETCKLLGGCDLLRINRRRRLNHVHDFLDLLEMEERQV